MRQVFSFGRFYGPARKQVENPAFAFTEVEDFQNSRLPVHARANAHLLFVTGGQYEASIGDSKTSLCASSTAFYYTRGNMHADDFSTAAGNFLTISLF